MQEMEGLLSVVAHRVDQSECTTKWYPNFSQDGGF